MQKKYSIETHCPSYGSAPDYHPMNAADIVYLLNAARDAKYRLAGGDATRTIASIQVRFNQAIPGMQTPRPIHGQVAAHMNALDNFYVRWIQAIGPNEPVSEWLVRQFDLLLNGGQCCETDAPEVIAFYRSLASY